MLMLKLMLLQRLPIWIGGFVVFFDFLFACANRYWFVSHLLSMSSPIPIQSPITMHWLVSLFDAFQPHFKHFWWMVFFLFIEPRVKSWRIIFPEWRDNFPNFVPIKWKTTASNSIIAIEIVQNHQPIVKMCTTFRAIGKSENWQSIYESNENVVWHCGIA